MKRIDPTLLLLFFGLVFFTGILIFVEKVFSTDGQVFQVISGVLTGFAGAFFGRMKPQVEHPNEISSATTTVSTSSTEPKLP